MKYTLPVFTDATFWNYKYIWPRTQIINSELQTYVDPSDEEFSSVIGERSITARRSTERLKSLYLQPYMSGLVTTHKRFAMKYGNIDVVMSLEWARGLWPAGWGLMEKEQWPGNIAKLPEIDIFEIVKKILHATLHSYDEGWENVAGKHIGTVQRQGKIARKVDISQMNTYSLRWTPDDMKMLFNGEVVGEFDTPGDMQNFFHLLFNLAVGGWGGKPTAGDYPAVMQVQSITVEPWEMMYPEHPSMGK